MSKKKNSKSKNVNNNKNEGVDIFNSPLCYIIAIAPFFIGLAYAWQYLLFTWIVLAITLGYVFIRRKLVFYTNVSVYLGLGLLFFSFITIFTSSFHGNAVYGFLRILCLAFWVILLMQLDCKERNTAISIIPSVAFISVILCALMYVLGDSLRDFVFINGRLNGFFQYANTFALFLLIAFIINVWNEEASIGKNELKTKKWKQIVKSYVYPVGLLIGILWTGSRTVFIMTGIAVICCIIFKKKSRIYLGIVAVLGIVLVGLFVLLTDNTSSIGRFLTISTESSTFLGRILYWEDAFKMLLNNPLGLGDSGFYLMQGGEQSGVYILQYVHNDWLQVALDFGLPFFICFAALFIWQIIKTKGLERVLIILIGLHMIMDFDLEFMYMSFLLLLFMKWDDKGKHEFLLDDNLWVKIIAIFTFVVFAVPVFWLGLSDYFSRMGYRELAAKMYPWELKNYEYYVTESNTPEEYESRATNLLKMYGDDDVALDVLALCEASNNNYLKVKDYKVQSVRQQKYRTEVYDDLIMMMDTGADYYKAQGNYEAAQECIDTIKSVPNMLQNVKDNTNSIAYRIYDKPNFELSDSSVQILKKYNIL